MRQLGDKQVVRSPLRAIGARLVEHKQRCLPILALRLSQGLLLTLSRCPARGPQCGGPTYKRVPAIKLVPAITADS